MKLSAVQERLQKNAVIIAARQCIYNSVKEFNISLKVGDISDVITKGTTPQTYGFDFVPEGIPFLRAEDILDGEIGRGQTNFFLDAETNSFMNRSRTRSGDILITIAGTIGRAAVVSDVTPEMNINQAIALIRCKKQINPYYIYHMIQSYGIQQQITKSTVTSAIPNLSLSMIRDLKIPIPPIKDQNIIAMFLEAIHKKQEWNTNADILPSYIKKIPRIISNIQQLTNKIEEARGLRREVMQEVEAMIKSSWKNILENIVSPNWIPLKQLVKRIENGWSPACESYPALDNEWGILKLSALSSGYFNASENKALPITIEPKQEYEVQIGDFLMSRANTTELVGACVLVRQTRPKLMLSDKIFRFNFFENPQIDLRYLEYVLKSPNLRTQIELHAAGTSSSMKNISKEDTLNLAIPYCSPKEQVQIVTYLDSLQFKIAAIKLHQAETSAELDALLPSILDKAFKGEL